MLSFSSHTRWRRAGCLSLLVLGAALIGLAARDLPRQLVESYLARTLCASVHLESLELSRAGARLRGLDIEAPRIRPEVDRFRIDELTIEGEWRELWYGRITRVRLAGGTLELRAPDPEAAVPPPATELLLDQLEIADLVLVLPTPSSGSDEKPSAPPEHFALEATLTRPFSSPVGRLAVQGESLSPAALAALAGYPTDTLQGSFDAPRLTIESSTETVIDFRAESFRGKIVTASASDSDSASDSSPSANARPLLIAQPQLKVLPRQLDGRWTSMSGHLETGSLALGAAGDRPFFASPWFRAAVEADLETPETFRVTAQPELPGLQEARLRLQGPRTTGSLPAGDLRVRGFHWPDTLVATGTEGDLDLDLGWDSDRISCRTEVRATSVDLPDLRLALERAVLMAEGEILLADTELPSPLHGPLRVRLSLSRATGSWRQRPVPANFFPLSLELDGVVGGGDSPSFLGRAEISHPLIGRLVADGQTKAPLATEADLEADPEIDLSWSWTRARLPDLLALAETALGETALGETALGETALGETALGETSLGEGVASNRPGEDGTSIRISSGTASGQGTLQGSLASPRLSGELTLETMVAELTADTGDISDIGDTGRMTSRIQVDHLQTRVLWTGTGAVDLPAISAQGTLPALPPLPRSPFTLTGRGKVQLDPAGLDIEEAELVLPAIVRATGQVHGRWPPGGSEAWFVGRLDELDLARWRALLGLPGLGFAVSGAAALDLRTAHYNEDSWELEGDLAVDNFGFTSDDGGRVLEGLPARWTLRATQSRPGEPVRATASGSSGGFLLLWNTFFADLSTLSAEWRASGEWQPAPDPRWQLSIGATVADGPLVEARLDHRSKETADPAATSYSLHLHIEDLAAGHRRYLGDHDVLSDLELAGTTDLRVVGELTREDLWRAQGTISLQDLAWSRESGDLLVQDLDLELPFDLRRAGTTTTGVRLKGSIAAGRLAFRQLGLAIPATELWIEGDALGFDEPLTLQALGGVVSFERLSLVDLATPNPRLAGGLRLSELDLGAITRRLETLPVEGDLSGFFPSFSLSADALEVAGGGTVDLFGGTVQVRGISGSEIFTPFPRLQLSADFQELDLLQITRRFDFGEMTGLISGSIEEAELFRGVPVSFRARVVTARRRGTPRTVDVKAVNNLSILGTGQSGGGALDRWFQRFFQRYTYRALGVDIELANDALLLRGREKRGERELFLRGRLPFRIDIVNAQPGRTVSFQAMSRRLEQLDFSAATTTSGGNP